MTNDLHRHIEVKITISCDSLEDLAHALAALEFRVMEAQQSGNELIDLTSGGWSSSYSMQTTVDPKQTGDLYRAQLKAWMDERKASW